MHEKKPTFFIFCVDVNQDWCESSHVTETNQHKPTQTMNINETEKTYIVTIVIQEGKSPWGGEVLPAATETLEVKAPREGLAKTRAMTKSLLRAKGRFVDYIISEA